MQNKRALLWAILVSISVFSIILALSMFRHLKNMETEHNRKGVALIKSNMDLKDQVGILRDELTKRAETLTRLEEENKKMQEEYAGKLEALEKENSTLAAKLGNLGKRPLVQVLRDAAYREESQDVRRFLEKVLYNIVLVKSGRSVVLEPIVVAKKRESRQLGATEKMPVGITEEGIQEAIPIVAGKRGKVLSVDKKYNLIVIDLGRKDEIKEEQQCMILKDNKEIALAKIISVRYKVSAAFVDEIKYNYNISDIKDGDSVLVME